MNADISRVLAAAWPHVHDVHDISVAALAAAVVTLGVVIMLELRSVLKLRQVMDNNLARVFEQLDLLRFESQQLIEGQQLIEAHAQGAALLPPQNPVLKQSPSRHSPELIVAPAAAAPVTGAEARLLSSLAQARARREASGPLRA